MNFALMAFHPLIPFANGQFTIYKRCVLDKIGGFEKIKDEVLDDIKMVNLLRKLKFKTKILSGKDISFCRMYHDTKSLFMGFIKSYFAIFDYHFLLSIFVFTISYFCIFLPLHIDLFKDQIFFESNKLSKYIFNFYTFIFNFPFNLL